MNNNESYMDIPKKKNVLLLFLLSIVTLLTYTYIWYIKRSPELNNLKTKSKLDKSLPLISLLLFILVILAAIGMVAVAKIKSVNPNPINAPIEFQILFGIEVTLILICLIVYIMMAFKVHKILNQSLINKESNVKLSALYTLVFNFLYLQYEINRIIDDKEGNRRTGPLISLILLVLSAITIGILYYLKIPSFLFA